MTMTIIDAHGKPLMNIAGTESVIAANTPPGGRGVAPPLDGSFEGKQFFNEEWITLPPKQSELMQYNYANRAYEYCTSVEGARMFVWERCKDERNSFEISGFEYNGKRYDSDPASQSRIVVAASSGLAQTWVTADNEEVDLSVEEMGGLLSALQAHLNETHERGRVARRAIDTAKSVEEIDLINF